MDRLFRTEVSNRPILGHDWNISRKFDFILKENYNKSLDGSATFTISAFSNRTQEVEMTVQILRRPEVERTTGLSRSTIYKAMTENAFPKPIRIGRRAVGWRQADIMNWLETRPQAHNDYY